MFNPNQPRDDEGRFTSGKGSEVAKMHVGRHTLKLNAPRLAAATAALKVANHLGITTGEPHTDLALKVARHLMKGS